MKQTMRVHGGLFQTTATTTFRTTCLVDNTSLTLTSSSNISCPMPMRFLLLPTAWMPGFWMLMTLASPTLIITKEGDSGKLNVIMFIHCFLYNQLNTWHTYIWWWCARAGATHLTQRYSRHGLWRESVPQILPC